MEKYEISLWEDYQKTGENFFREKKIAVIGSSSMAEHGVQARALEPNLVEDINGTTTFTFKMYYTYTDNKTGEKYENPFSKYLVNERKVKVFWKNKWYDLVIKKCQEDSANKSIVYTCTDLFINELSKQGYSLEFDTELENNIGTAEELATAVLDGSTWQYDKNASTAIVQKTEGPVYEVKVKNTFSAKLQSLNSSEDGKLYTFAAGKIILVFYDSLVNLQRGMTTKADIQFLWASSYTTDVNDMLVTNGECYNIENASCTRTSEGSDDILDVKIGDALIFQIDLNGGVSEHYRAERLVRSQRTEYDALLDRYVAFGTLEDGKEIYEIATTEYTDPLAIINLVANPTEFTNVQGWIGSVDGFGLYPKFGTNTDITTYSAKSFLKLKVGDTYNTGIQSNINYFKATDSQIKDGNIGGIQVGEKYVFRVKAQKNSGSEPNTKPSGEYTTYFKYINCNLYKYKVENNKYQKIGDPIFKQISATVKNDHWAEHTLVCQKSLTAKELEEYGLFVTVSDEAGIYCYWIEDIQFFKYAEGKTSYNSSTTQRINPGEISLQSIVKPVYKYYLKNNNAKSADELTYLWVGEERWSSFLPTYNNYEKIGTIFEKESNRFNILQSIAETFQAWVKFRIDHNDDGSIIIKNYKPQKFVYFVSEVGEDTGISFEYGIDLKTISRTINSDKLVTKVIVKPNDNEFAPDGFCSIAKSDSNYTKENFILNLDYYTQQGLLDKEQLYNDLYTLKGIGYYYYLHSWNKQYDEITETLRVKNLDLVRQQAQIEVYEQYLLAAREQLEIIKSDLMNLAGVSQWKDVQTYARKHASNEKVQALLNSYSEVNNEITKQSNLLSEAQTTINKLQEYIDSLTTNQKTLLEALENKHKTFNNKYSTFIMEGTWQDNNYIDADKYYLDGLNVAYTSSRPQLSYTINVLRLSSLEEYSSKVFNLGDICYMQDREFFGYLTDKITPYKERILVSKLSSFFDQPERDVITVQNYKTRFDDLFQRIAATTQSLQYQEGAFTRAADVIKPDGTISFAALQNTFNANADLVLNSSNQDVVWDNTGITVTDKFNSASKTKIIAGGIFVTNDGGATWKNAVRGDGISADLLTAGRINTGAIYLYDGNVPSFRWDSDGISAYAISSGAQFNKFVRLDQYGLYGYDGTEDFKPKNENEIWENINTKYGMTWKGFFLRGTRGNSGIEISDNGEGITFKLKSGSDQRLFEISTSDEGMLFHLKNMSDSKNGIEIKSDSSSEDFTFAIKSSDNDDSFEITANNHIRVISNGVARVRIGRWKIDDNTIKYGIWVRDQEGYNILRIVNDNDDDTIGGWTLNRNSFYHTVGSNTIGLFSRGKDATINGHEGTYYILAGSKFGVTIDGKVYAKEGQIGGWNMTSSSLFAGTTKNDGTLDTTKPYTRINANGTLEGRTDSSNNWSIRKDGNFYFNSSAITGETGITSQIVLGPTTINNHYIHTTHLSASGGSIGGCSISGGGISSGSWVLGSGGLSLNGVDLTAEETPMFGWISYNFSKTSPNWFQGETCYVNNDLTGTTQEATGTMYIDGKPVSFSIPSLTVQFGGTLTVKAPIYSLSGTYSTINVTVLRTKKASGWNTYDWGKLESL